MFSPARIQSIQPGQTQQYYIKHPKYYHTHTTHRQTQVQPQPDRPIPLTAGYSPIKGEWVLTWSASAIVSSRCHYCTFFSFSPLFNLWTVFKLSRNTAALLHYNQLELSWLVRLVNSGQGNVMSTVAQMSRSTTGCPSITAFICKVWLKALHGHTQL